jgi:hypothetical protein
MRRGNHQIIEKARNIYIYGNRVVKKEKGKNRCRCVCVGIARQKVTDALPKLIEWT